MANTDPDGILHPAEVQQIPDEMAALLRFLQQSFNRKVRGSFHPSINIDEGTWDSWSDEQQLYYLLQVKENDTEGRIVTRLLLFMLERGGFTPPIFGIPASNYAEDVKYHPQVTFIFQEEAARAIRAGRIKAPVRRRLSFRILQNSSNITQTELNELRLRITEEFPRSFRLKAGRNNYPYVDLKHGIPRTSIFLFDQSEALEVYTKFCACVAVLNPGCIFNEENLGENSAVVPGKFDQQETIEILGKPVKTPKRRQITQCYLKEVEMAVWPEPPFILWDQKWAYARTL